MIRKFLLFFLCLTVLPAGGCARSDDGTVVIPSMLDSRRLWGFDRPKVKTVRQNTVNLFPGKPQQPRIVYVKPSTEPKKRIRISQPVTGVESAHPSKPLSCRNVSQPGQRAKMVCE